MDICITGAEYNVFEYMVNHRNSWISEESIMESNSIPNCPILSSYLSSQENIRELIKIEEIDIDHISGDGGSCSSVVTEDSKDAYNLYREEYMAHKSEISSVQFPSKMQLMSYERTYQTDKPYKYDKYGKQFSKSSSSKKHKLTHTGEKVFICDECGKQFSQNSFLKRHKVVHTGEKSFTCDEYDKQFAESGNLKEQSYSY